MRIDVKTRFAFVLLIVNTALMGVFALGLYSTVRERLRASAEQSLASFLDKEWRHLQLHDGEVFLDQGSQGAGETYLQILKNGILVFDSVPTRYKDNSGNGLLAHWTDKITRDFHGHIKDSRFEMVGYYDLNSNSHYLLELKSILIRRCLLALLFFGPFSWWLAKVLLRPFKKLSQNTLELDAQKLSFRFLDPGNKDEYGNLVKSFNTLLERLESSFHQLKRFSGNVSHELRTPLTVIRGEAEWLLRKPRAMSEYEEGLKKIIARSDGIQSIVSRLLFLADLERTQLDSSASEVQVNQRVGEIIESLKKIHHTQERKIEVEQAHVSFFGQSDLFSSITTNVLENAFKYSKSKMKVEFRHEGKGLYFSVEDDGPGIPMEKREKIFEPFFKVRLQESAPGPESHGLGLSIVKACVEAIQGKIELGDSKLGGLLVKIWVPEA